MNTNYKLAMALGIGAVIGGAAIQALHAQAKPPAYVVIAIQKVNDPAAFKAGVTDKANPADLKAAGGERIIRSTKLIGLDGNTPTFFTIQKFDSLEKAQAFVKTPAQEEINAARIRTTNSFSFIVEGIAN